MPLSDSPLITSSVVFAGTFFATAFVIHRLRSKNRVQNYPPSIGTMPILGSMLYIPDMSQMHTFFLEKSNSLGDIISFSLTGKYTVVLNSRNSIQEALVKKASDFSDRPVFYLNKYINPKIKGISDGNYTPEFKKYHQLSLSILKRFGFGQNIMEERISLEVEDLMKHLRELGGSEADPQELVKSSVLNIISGVLFGKRYCGTVSTVLIESIQRLINDSIQLLVLDFFPSLRFLPSYRKCIRELVEATEEINRQTGEKIDRVEEKIKEKGGDQREVEDYESFIEGYIDIEGAGCDKEQLIYTVRDMVMAGSDTSSTTILWAMVTLANEPEIQSRLHSEISSAASHDGQVSVGDRLRLPYTEAFTLELMRRRPLAVFAPHCTSTDTTLLGYFIPKDTMILLNLYAVHMNPKVWEKPEEFRPERFLDDAGTTVINKEMIIPFSVGRRACMGELLARQEIFKYLTSLVLNFHILPPEGQDKVDVQEIAAATLCPSPYRIRFLPRSQ